MNLIIPRLQTCQQPLFQGGGVSDEVMDETGIQVMPIGAYSIPSSCEYCGAEHLAMCPSDCDRPKLYFRKKRPPFCPPDKYDPITDYALPPTPRGPVLEHQSKQRQLVFRQQQQSSSRSHLNTVNGGIVMDEETKQYYQETPSDASIPVAPTATSWVSGLFRGSSSQLLPANDLTEEGKAAKLASA